MTIHYHGTPITPGRYLEELAGRSFCVSYAAPSQVKRCHEIGQSVMLDNGAFSLWTRGLDVDWKGYYGWVEPWLEYPTTWAVIPDVIGGGTDENDRLVAEWPFGWKGSPVWHLDEPVDRLVRLCDQFPRICFGSAGAWAKVGDASWRQRVVQVFDALTLRYRKLPWIHMLRGMDQCGKDFPFASVDSTNAARNHRDIRVLEGGSIKELVERLDSIQCPGSWKVLEQPCFLFGERMD